MRSIITLIGPVLAGLATAAPTVQRRDGLAPLYPRADHAETNGGYIVIMNSDVESPEAEISTLGLETPLGTEHIFTGATKGFAGKFAPDVLERIRAMPSVAYVEPD